jgi:hypothetical protein
VAKLPQNVWLPFDTLDFVRGASGLGNDLSLLKIDP